MRKCAVAALSLLMGLAGCGGTLHEQKVEAFKTLDADVDRYYKAAEGKLTPAHAEACANGRKGRTEKIVVQGAPQYAANRFLTCVANQSGGLFGRLSRPSGSFYVAYDTRIPIKKPAGIKEVTPSSSGQWLITVPCLFLVDGDNIEVQADAFSADGGPGGVIPARIGSNNGCFYMPGSERYVKRF